MDTQCLSSRNRTAGYGNPGVVPGNGGRTPPKASGDRNQSLNAAGSSSGGRRGTPSFPPTFSGDEPRPLQTDFFRHVALFYAHLGPEDESEQWASYLPEYLRPGSMEKYLEETDKPQLYGNNYWWLSPKNLAQEQPSFNQSSDHIRYSRVQLLELREVMAVPENILKIKQEIEAECLGVNQITKGGGTNIDMSGARRERRSASKKKKEEKKVAAIPLNSTKKAPQTGEKEKHEVASIPLDSMKDAPLRGEKEKHEVENISVNLMKVSLERGEKEKHEVANVSVNSMKEVPQTGEKEKHKAANVSVDSMKEAPQSGEKEKHGVANISVNSMQEEPQTGEKEKQEGFVSESKKEKKKRRVLTDERKEKKKIAKKKKRAEKNRKLGVKRLKIQPLLKPKPVSHCRHYLKGRCHEGEECKFSHDVQPLTKSLPCCHFARQSCMKGDDCPYDHDLSKYPCNKYVTTGFCPRQENCLFSHKVMPNQDPASTTGVTHPETKTSNPPPASDSIQRQNKPIQESKGTSLLSLGKANISQKPHFVFGARNQQTEISSAENPKDDVPASKADQPVKTPKGFTFLNIGNSRKDQPSPLPFGNSNKTAFGGDKKDAAVPSNPPASPNSAGVFVFGKNSPHDPNKKNRPSLPPFANHNNTAFGGNKQDAAAPSNPPSAFSARLNALMKNTSSPGQRSSLSTSASGPSPINGSETNKNQGTGPTSGSEPVEPRVNVNASAGTNSASADASKNGGASLKKPLSAVEVWEMLYGSGSKK